MPRLSLVHRNGAGLLLLWCAVVACCALLPARASAQGAKSKKAAADGEKKTGTISHVEKKGKNATITVEESDGEKFDVSVNAKTNFVVHGKGDISYFKHGSMFVSSDEVVRNSANNYLHGRKFTIYLGGKGPGERMEQDPVSPDVCLIAGTVIDADDESFTFEAEGAPYKVAFDPAGVDVSFESTEPEHAAVGAKAEVEGTTRGGKFHPLAIVVTLEKPMRASEAFAGGDKKAKSKTGSKTTGKKTTAKNDKGTEKGADKGTDKSAGKGTDGGDKAKDPFKVLDGGDDKKDGKKGADKGKASTPKKDKKTEDGDANN
jgi:hypothetical protein